MRVVHVLASWHLGTVSAALRYEAAAASAHFKIKENGERIKIEERVKERKRDESKRL